MLGLQTFTPSKFRMLGITTVRMDYGFSPAEIAKLRQAAELTKKKAETLWSRGQNAAAARMEEEWSLQWRRIRELEEERNAKGA